MNCEKASEWMNLAIDDMLTTVEKKALMEHIETCPSCKEEYELLESIQNSLKSEETASLPEGFHETLMKRIEEEEVNKTIPLKKPFFKKINFGQLNMVAAALLVVVIGLAGIRSLNDVNMDKSSNMVASDSDSGSTEMASQDYSIEEEAVDTASTEMTETQDIEERAFINEAPEEDYADQETVLMEYDNQASQEIIQGDSDGQDEMLSGTRSEKSEAIMSRDDSAKPSSFTTMEEPEETIDVSKTSENENSIISKSLIIPVVGMIVLLGVGIIGYKRFR